MYLKRISKIEKKKKKGNLHNDIKCELTLDIKDEITIFIDAKFIGTS